VPPGEGRRGRAGRPLQGRYRGLPDLPDVPVPYTLTPEAEALLNEPGQAAMAPQADHQEVTA
jgi:hypothetical protein